MNKILATCLVICLVIELGSFNVWALKESVPEIGPKVLKTGISSPTMAATNGELPDLTIVSAVIGRPHMEDYYHTSHQSTTETREYIYVPLTITFTNLGASIYDEFNVGGWGKSIDGNAYGNVWWPSEDLFSYLWDDLGINPFFQDDRHYIFELPRKGIVCDHLASGEVRTYELDLIMYSNVPPVTRRELEIWTSESGELWYDEYVNHTYYALLDIGTQYEIHVMVDYNLDPDSGSYQWGVDESNEMNNELVITGRWPHVTIIDELSYFLLSGRVFNEQTGEVIRGAWVKSTDHTGVYSRDSTGTQGLYTVSVRKSVPTLITVTARGYKTATRNITQNEDWHWDFGLEPAPDLGRMASPYDLGKMYQ